ncbi:MAG: glycosyltransferase family 4 protein [Ignavibacteriaceae bacterium]|nr:glycosyltransferase family 4 protein [Ignavibacteriaceae bacterium]
MNIGIDARLLGEKITGITRYLINVLEYLPLYDTKNNYSLFTYKQTEFDANFYKHHIVYNSKLPRQIKEHLWLNFTLPKILDKESIDIFFTPYILVPLKKTSKKNVIVIHDVMTKACPQFFTTYYKKYMSVVVPKAIKRADEIVTVSQSAKNDIVRYYGVQPDKITVTQIWTDGKYKPLTLNHVQINQIKKKFDLPEIFILFVGALEERKNITGILKISDILKSRHIDIKIVLVGNRGFGFDRFEDEIIKRKDRVLLIDYVLEQDLPLIYNLAKIFLFPSYYEGFGLPPLEAMKCGLPVLAGKNSSLIEVVSDGGLMFESEDYDSFASSVIELLQDKKFYESMKFKALMQSEKFKPENEITKLIELFNSMN